MTQVAMHSQPIHCDLLSCMPTLAELGYPGKLQRLLLTLERQTDMQYQGLLPL